MDTIIRNGKLVIPKVGIVDGDIAIENGKIAAILSPGTACEAETVIDASGKYVFPGCIDPHVHWGCYQDMGVDTRMESAAAAIGGYTTCLQYRRTPGPNFEPQYVQQLLDVMTPNSYIDYGLQLFITKQDHKNTVDLAVKEMGVSSFKFFTTERNVDVDIRGLRDSGIPEPYTDGFMYESMQELAKYDGNVVANFHPENIELVETVAPKVKAAGEMGLAAWDHVRPEIAEAETVSRLSYFSEKTGCPLYCVHISCAEAAEKIAQGKKTNPRLYGETTPHYLVLNTDSPCAELGKVNPPLREAYNNDKLWQYLADGTLDTVGSDNCANVRADKAGTIWDAACGFHGTGTMLPVLLSEGYHKGKISLERIAEVTSYNVARIFNMPEKGKLQPGTDADLVIVNLDKEKVVNAADLKSYSDFSVFEGWNLKGWPVMTLVRGSIVAKDGEIVGEPHGQYLKRNAFLSV